MGYGVGFYRQGKFQSLVAGVANGDRKRAIREAARWVKSHGGSHDYRAVQLNEAGHITWEDTPPVAELQIPADSVLTSIEAAVRSMAGRGDVPIAYMEHMSDGGYALGIVVEGESGYHPLSSSLGRGTASEVKRLADRLNTDRLQLTLEEVISLICQSMRKP